MPLSSRIVFFNDYKIPIEISDSGVISDKKFELAIRKTTVPPKSYVCEVVLFLLYLNLEWCIVILCFVLCRLFRK